MARDLPPRGPEEPEEPDRPEESGKRRDLPEWQHLREDSGNADPVVTGGRRWSAFELRGADERPDTPYALDQDLGGDSPQRRLGRFDPEAARLPALDRDQARAYIGESKGERPWLAPAADRCADTQRVVACADQGQGHAVERHEGDVDDVKLTRRVRELADPAQRDPEPRDTARDAFTGRRHVCADTATSIFDPDAFATAYAGGVEHPKVREVLDREYRRGPRIDGVRIPIEDLLGPEGHRYCIGYRLVGDDMKIARESRNAWVVGEKQGPGPEIGEIPTFEGGTIEFRFRPTKDGTGYEIATMFPHPPERDDEQAKRRSR